MNGVLGAKELFQSTAQAIYGCGKTQATLLTVSVVNKQHLDSAKISLAISNNQTTPAITDWIEYEVEIKPRGTLVRTGIYVPTGFYLIARSNKAKTNVICWGVEIGDDFSISPIIEQAPASIDITAPTWNTGETLPIAFFNESYSFQLSATDS